MLPVAPVVTDVTLPFAFRIYSYLNIFSSSVLIAVISEEVALSIYIIVPFSLSRVIKSGLMLGVLYYYYYYYNTRIISRNF